MRKRMVAIGQWFNDGLVPVVWTSKCMWLLIIEAMFCRTIWFLSLPLLIWCLRLSVVLQFVWWTPQCCLLVLQLLIFHLWTTLCKILPQLPVFVLSSRFWSRLRGKVQTLFSFVFQPISVTFWILQSIARKGIKNKISILLVLRL